MTSIDMEFPQIPRLSPADEIQARRALRSNRLLATGLLALMIVIAITTRFVPSPGWLVQLVRAGAEAGIIGGLADWFAITVLFRHPFGMPLPHTAILPSNKDRIGRSLGSFVERNFLVPEIILPKMHQADLTGKIAGWLALPETVPTFTDRGRHRTSRNTIVSMAWRDRIANRRGRAELGCADRFRPSRIGPR